MSLGMTLIGYLMCNTLGVVKAQVYKSFIQVQVSYVANDY